MKKNTKNRIKITVDKTPTLKTSTKRALLIGGGIIQSHFLFKYMTIKKPYKKVNGLYVRALHSNLKGIILLTTIQAKEINNLLIAKKAIDEEIKKIKKSKSTIKP
jgi:hypothetical protein